MATWMNNAIHVQIEVVKLDVIGIGPTAIHRNGLSIHIAGLKVKKRNIHHS